MENNLHTGIDMEKLSADFYVSYSWFRRVFKQETGKSPSAYHMDLRMEAGCRKLRETKSSIRHISESLGFKNQNHFSALFKRKTGLSPVHWRENQN